VNALQGIADGALFCCLLCCVILDRLNVFSDTKIKGSSCDPFFVRVFSCAETKKPAEAGFNARTLSYQLLVLVGN
jgi:hypothetical protein